MESIVKDKPSVLIIDDDGDIRQYLRKLLKDSYNVYEAKDTVEGLEIVMQADPDIIVCDVVIKEFSGIEFCSKLKDSPSFSHIPVILLTGSSSPEIKLKGVECGADDYITKPFENDLLVARIKSILKGRNTLKQFFLNEVTLKSNNLKIPEEYSYFLTKCISLIEKHLDDENFSVSVFTREMGMSRSNLFRKVKAISGLNISEFIRHIKLRKAAELMIQSDLQIKEVAYKIGFQDVRYFREQFCKLFEMNPSDFIRKYRKTFVKSYNLGAGMAPENTR
jgi:YesN/AraC family two-component response regulator